MILITITSLLVLSSCIDSTLARTTGEQNFCELQPEGGFCRGSFEKFYYDPTVKTCLPFIYGGCQGNKNNFDTFEECVMVCGRKEAIKPVEGNDIKEDFEIVGEPNVGLPAIGKQVTDNKEQCYERPVTGQCFGYFPRYYYNPNKNTCEEFIYGGCHGNGNNFETIQECEKKCKHDHASYSLSEEEKIAEFMKDLKRPTCQQMFGINGEPNGLKCDALFPSWSYDKDTKSCKKFIYGGCGGNKNRFRSKGECEETCHVH